MNGRNKTNLVKAMAKQVEAVRAVIADLVEEGVNPRGVQIRPSLCFLDVDWPWFAHPMHLDGVRISGPRSLAKVITQPGNLGLEQVVQFGSRLAERLPPA